MKYEDKSGQWWYVSPVGKRQRMHERICRDCNKKEMVLSGKLKSRCRSCHIRHINYTHRGTGSSLLWVFYGMRGRCHRETDKNYNRYGGRGVTICDEWKDFPIFRDWALENGYEKGLTIDRIDNDGNYEPLNCRWITKSENSKKAMEERWNRYENKEHKL